MNWYKKSQTNDFGAILYAMLMEAHKNPSKPLSVAQRFSGSLPSDMASAINFAYTKAVFSSGGMLNESQQRLIAEAQSMASGALQNNQLRDNLNNPQPLNQFQQSEEPDFVQNVGDTI